MSTGDVVEAMAVRLANAATRRGIDRPGAELLLAAFRAAVEPRRAKGVAPADLLHPARTVLILLDDMRIVDPNVLAAGALTESEHVHLALPADFLRRDFPLQVAQLVAAVPRPAECGDALLEALLLAPPAALQVALAERLDQARHLHLRPRAVWPGQHELIGTVYLPVAARSNGVLENRLRWWYRMFEQRFLVA